MRLLLLLLRAGLSGEHAVHRQLWIHLGGRRGFRSVSPTQLHPWPEQVSLLVKSTCGYWSRCNRFILISTSVTFTSDLLQDWAAETVDHLLFWGHVPAPFDRQHCPQPLGDFLLFHRKQVTTVSCIHPCSVIKEIQVNWLTRLCLPDMRCLCSPPCWTWCVPMTQWATVSPTTTCSSLTTGSSWWNRLHRSLLRHLSTMEVSFTAPPRHPAWWNKR